MFHSSLIVSVIGGRIFSILSTILSTSLPISIVVSSFLSSTTKGLDSFSHFSSTTVSTGGRISSNLPTILSTSLPISFVASSTRSSTTGSSSVESSLSITFSQTTSLSFNILVGERVSSTGSFSINTSIGLRRSFKSTSGSSSNSASSSSLISSYSSTRLKTPSNKESLLGFNSSYSTSSKPEHKDSNSANSSSLLSSSFISSSSSSTPTFLSTSKELITSSNLTSFSSGLFVLVKNSEIVSLINCLISSAFKLLSFSISSSSIISSTKSSSEIRAPLSTEGSSVAVSNSVSISTKGFNTGSSTLIFSLAMISEKSESNSSLSLPGTSIFLLSSIYESFAALAI